MRMDEESRKRHGLKLNIKRSWNHGIWGPYFMANGRGKVEVVTIYLLGLLKSLWIVTANHEIRRLLLLGRRR